MIECLRIDDRLLHGQVITKWITRYDPDAIVIADDGVVKDEIAKMALRIAKPDGMKMSIRSVDDALVLLNNDQTKHMKLFVLVKDTVSAKRIVEGVAHVKTVNIGGLRSSREGARSIFGVIKATQEDLDIIGQIHPLVGEIDVRTVPSEENRNILEYL
ncbi:MAG: PTS sugar transporter subunit IIB [Lachnospiraceae bacterium]|nr:PTS sugar transporter subunit IIB [Lachnospiraceae bacterium]